MTDAPNTTPRWRGCIAVHPVADWFPLLPDAELAALGRDIRENGLHTKPAYRVVDGSPELLDGRNRLAAMEREGMLDDATRSPDAFRGWLVAHGIPVKPEVDPTTFIVSMNIHRRHLTTAEKRDLIARLLKAMPEKSDRQIAEVAKVHNETVGTVRSRLVATGEIPQQTRTVGKDGKVRQRPEPVPRVVETRQQRPTPPSTPPPAPDAAFEAEVQRRVKAEVERRVASVNKREAEARRIIDAQLGILSDADYRVIWAALHTDRRGNTAEARRLFALFTELRPVLVKGPQEEADPDAPEPLPATPGDLLARRMAADAARKAERDARKVAREKRKAREATKAAKAAPPVGSTDG